jgi:hypothetical protein
MYNGIRLPNLNHGKHRQIARATGIAERWRYGFHNQAVAWNEAPGVANRRIRDAAGFVGAAEELPLGGQVEPSR